MKREEKQVIIDSLTEQIKSYKHMYISDISELDAVATQKLRSECFKAGVKLIQVKNTLLKVALDNLENNYEELYGSLVGSSAVMLSETGNVPAKLIKEFRKSHDKPVLKAAFVEESVYVGENQLESLVSLKSKEELLGDVILLLQSPMQKLISSLESGKNTIGGVLKTLEDRA
ncbi:50S ribosomal protein L10 [Odoribacter sp. OttesenSCG-928-A06]|nr:50S ribosomal protein L10 [Odoribacter sp. OttesenSCG-928-A06]